MEVRELLSSYEFPGRRHPASSRARPWWRSTAVIRSSRDSILELMNPVDLHPAAGASVDLLPDAVEDVFSISGRGTVVTGPYREGIVKVGEEVEIVGIVRFRDDLHGR